MHDFLQSHTEGHGVKLHSKYLPFTEQQFLSHFADVKQNGKCIKNDRHLEYYKNSIKRCNAYLHNNPNRLGKSIKEMRIPCQIEKDERFWIANCMITIFYSQNRSQELVHLLEYTYGNTPPCSEITSWAECIGKELNLFFETNLPSPKSYNDWLQKNLPKRQFIPYVLDSAEDKKNFEGPTNVDTILMNPENGFAILIEAKVLSDISCKITYDPIRNQIPRNIDVVLGKNPELCPPLNKRDPQKTLFLLITPKIFKDNPSSSRFYGYKFNEYKNNPKSFAADLPHRENCDWKNISSRIGWLTWEDFNNVNKDCCPWLKGWLGNSI